MKIKIGKAIPFVNLEIAIFKGGTQCNIGINTDVMKHISDEDQEKVTHELENAFKNITKILEK